MMRFMKIVLFLILLACVHWSSVYIGVELPEWADIIKIPIEKPWEKVNKPQPIRELREDPTYIKTIRSVMWIVTNEGQASGVLIDKELKRAVTNEHVTKNSVWVDVFFPVHNRNQKLISKRHFYTDRRNRVALYQLGYYTRGRVVAEDPYTDLAIVELDGLPETAREIDHNFSASTYRFMNVDEPVYILGNPGGRDLWRPKAGHFQGFDGNELHIKADAYFGNSGGPVFNKQGALLGIIARTNLDTMDTKAVPTWSIKNLLDTLKERHIFSIKNNTNLHVDYQYKWTASSDWKPLSIEPDSVWNHWHTGSSTEIPKGYPIIRFDEIVGDGKFTERRYKLEPYIRHLGPGVNPHSKADAREHHFEYNSKSKKLTLYLSKQ